MRDSELTFEVWLPEENLEEFRTGKATGADEFEPIGACLTLRNDYAIELYINRWKGKADALYEIFRNTHTDDGYGEECWEEMEAPACKVKWDDPRWKERLHGEMKWQLAKFLAKDKGNA